MSNSKSKYIWLLRSFLQDGYVVRVDTSYFVSLKHRSNGNTLQLFRRNNGDVDLYKNHIYVKTYEYGQSS